VCGEGIEGQVQVLKSPNVCILRVLDKDLHFSLEAGRYYEMRQRETPK